MENENTPTPPENKAEAPAVPSSPGLSSTKTEADAEPNSEPTMSANQAGLADATEEDSREQPVASRRPEREPEHTGSPQECSEELQMEEPSEMPSEAGPGNQSPLATQEGSMELQAVEEQAQSMELQAVKEQAQSMELQAGEGQAQSMELQAGEGQAQPSGDCVTPEGQPEPAMDQQEDLQSAEAQEIHPSQSCQVIPGDWGAKEPPVPLAEGNTDHGLETACTLDNRSQAQVDEPPSEAGLLQVRLQEPMPVPSSGTHKDSPPEPVSPKPMATAQEKKALPLLQSVPGPRIHKDRSEAVETKATPRPLPFTEVRDLEKKELTQGQKQRHQALAAVGAQGPGNHRRGFMKCLLEVEEQEEATHRRTLKTRTLTARKSSKNLTSVPTAGPANSSVPSLPLTLNEPSNSAPATMAPWVRTTGPGQAPASGGSPGSVLSLPTQDLSWRWPEMLPQSNERNLNFVKSRQELEEHGLYKLYQSWEERSEEHLTLKQEEAFRSYFDLFNGSGEVDARSLKNVLLLIGLNLTPAQLEEALMSADVNGDGHVDFKDFLAVMTDTKRFLYSVEQNVLMDMSPLNPYTLFFEILSLLVEMLALPEVALEEITNYYQKKLKEGSSKAREMESAISSLRSRKKLSYNPQQADNLEVPERRVLRILSRLKQQNYAANLQSPYAQVPCIPLCPRLDKKTVRRKQGSHNHSMLDHCVPTSLGPEIHGLFFQSGQQASREHSSDSRKWLNSVPARTH